MTPLPDDLAARLADSMREHERDRAELDRPLSRYERGAELGRGGLAVVHRAWDRKLRREVALKLLHPHHETSRDAQARFEREWRAAARLSHPNIVTVYDAGEEDGTMFLVMELVSGGPLSLTLAARRSELRPLLQTLEKVARAVHYAHEQGVVHRDLKPSNILVADSGEPKVADFGLAQIIEEEAAITGSGIAVGTPVYMAPEQVQGREIGPRTDVYALGAILYEMATGRPPHTGEGISEIYSRILNDEPVPPRRIQRTIPLDVEIMALKAIEKEPGRRYESALAFAEDLRRHLDHRPILAQPPSLVTRLAKRIRRRPAVSALAAMLAAAVLAASGLIAGSRVRHARNVAGKRVEARKAEAEGRLSEAADLYSRLRELEPGDAEAAHKSADLRARAIDADRRRRALELVEEARRIGTEEIPRVEAEWRRAEEEAARLSREVPFWEGPEKKRAMWQWERRAEERKRERLALRARALDALTTAWHLDPAAARAAYLEECWRRMGEAEADDDFESVAYWDSRIRSAGDASWTARLDAGGTIEIETIPPGAAAALFRYEEGEDRRLVARPVGAVAGKRPLPRGSYLIVFAMAGYPDVRYPVVIGRGTAHAAKVRLYAAAEIGDGFVYVPAGKFVMGGDPHAYLSGKPDAEASTGDFFIARFEVTLGEYVRFLNAVIVEEGSAAAQRRVPRSAPESGHFWEIPAGARETSLPPGTNPRWPVQAISWHDADAYCRWLTRREGGRTVYRLPTNVEWEKAARGADARFFPWGNRFDWSFAKGGESRPGKAELEEVGAFPTDESPHGVRDMAGSLREWCDPKEGERQAYAHVRGGAYPYSGVTSFHVATRLWIDPTNVALFNGFRVVRVPTGRRSP
ncbi:MAG: SUMF1/EgtB/PvdO family nonheme iron enzyme [Planctomycetes bacterium]|nr:SUMF1/EgtB/PvdO family nonheme iron enzyme [Planctomycetota bacterium]